MGDRDTHGWITAALLRELGGLEGHATFKNMESKFNFTLCIRQGSVEAPTRWLKLAKHILSHSKKRLEKMMK